VIRPWTIIAVRDVAESAAWYAAVLGADQTHPGATVFDQVADADGTILLCLHRWGPSGPGGDHHWPSLADPGEGHAGNGLLLWFVVGDFDDAWRRAQDLNLHVEEEPNTDNGTGQRAFLVRDPDGYLVAVNEAREARSD
jgi:catechol 2,3-dioxygenase-like lactoylglutathione lyase family enzyme